MLNKYLKASLSIALVAMGTIAVKANNAIVATIEAAKSGTTVTVSGTYSGITTEITVPSGVTVEGPRLSSRRAHLRTVFMCRRETVASHSQASPLKARIMAS